jgi:hypothetical protein
VIKIADFGLSKSLAQNEQAAKSQSTLAGAQQQPPAAEGEDWEDGLEEHQTERWVGGPGMVAMHKTGKIHIGITRF